MPVSIIGIARNSLKFTAVKAIAAAAMFGVTLYAATVLTPAEYGIYGVLSLWLTYVGLATPGIYAAAAREIPVLLGRQKEKDALSVQNVALSAEIIWAIFPTAAIIIAGFLQHDPVLKAGLWIVAGVYLASRLANLLAHINFTRERFNIVAAGELISGIVSPAVVFLCLHWLKVHALVIGPLVAACTVLAYYLVRGRIDFHFTLERQQVMRLAGSGVVLQGLAVVLTAFRIADRTIIASMLTRDQLGLYVFATGFLISALAFFQDFSRVLQPVLWRHAGAVSTAGFRDARRIAVYLALGTAIVVPLAQLIFALVVSLLTRQYAESIPVFYVLSYNLYFMAVATIPTLVLNSSLVNRQKFTFAAYALGLAVSIGAGILVLRLGWGIVAVATVSVATQAMVTLGLYFMARNYLSESATDFAGLGREVGLPLAGCLIFYFLHVYLRNAVGSLAAFAGISLAAQAVLWSLTISLFYRRYVSARECRLLLNELRAAVPGSRREDVTPV